MRDHLCYLGDDDLSGAAVYLASVLEHYQLPYDHVDSLTRLTEDRVANPYRLYILSDYPGANMTAPVMEALVRAVAEQGVGLLMIGGWESFFGRVGEYHRSPIAEALPVVLQGQDDRYNGWRPCVIEQAAAHPIVDDLPWAEAPAIGGFNRVTPKPEAKVALQAVVFRAMAKAGRFTFVRADEAPLLVLGRYGAGRVAAFTTDAAPHWVGGLVDWGHRRIVRQVADAYVEVGNLYVQLMANIVCWTAQVGEWEDALDPDEPEDQLPESHANIII